MRSHNVPVRRPISSHTSKAIIQQSYICNNRTPKTHQKNPNNQKKKPLHFTRIADHINIYWTYKKSLPQTVHNELIKDDRFVLVGRGTYGLSEWGLKGGTVREIIVSLLEKKQDSLHVDEIIEYVFSQKEVKRTTILVNLADQNYFIKRSKGKYFLK